jgi:F-type H+-transporting ATPase subunit c
MNEYAYLLHYSTIIASVILPCTGVALGQSFAGIEGINAINRQPAAHNDIMRTLILGMALTETAVVIGIALAMLLLFDATLTFDSLYPSLGRCGMALAVAITGLTVGLACAQPLKQACHAIACQPFFSQKIINLLLISQTLLQTPLIFGFLIAWFIKVQASEAKTLTDGLRLLSSGFALGFGSVGPIIGLSLFARTAIQGLGINRKAYSKLMTFTFISEAIIETPILFSFVIALVLITSAPQGAHADQAAPFIIVSTALCIGFGTLLPSLSSGRLAAAAAREIAQKPEYYSDLSRTSLFAQALIDTFVIYAALISLMMLLLRSSS